MPDSTLSSLMYHRSNMSRTGPSDTCTSCCRLLQKTSCNKWLTGMEDIHRASFRMPSILSMNMNPDRLIRVSSSAVVLKSTS
ncbi:hypothetical protein TNCV_372001 [Trichonephila clavipes]|nr:hypothetical protein TNCV_372001 [Trichonephila clavipes]